VIPTTLSPTESAPPFKGKGKAKDTEEELEDVEEENMCLREENAHLHMSVLGMRQYVRAQQADMLALSNKLFNMSQEWADFEKRCRDSILYRLVLAYFMVKALSDCCSCNHSLDVRSTMLLVRQNVGSCCT
jgi:hypothetical protein